MTPVHDERMTGLVIESGAAITDPSCSRLPPRMVVAREQLEATLRRRIL